MLEISHNVIKINKYTIIYDSFNLYNFLSNVQLFMILSRSLITFVIDAAANNPTIPTKILMMKDNTFLA